MKKLLTVVALLALVASLSSAQDMPGLNKWAVGPAVQLNLPMGDFGDYAGTGFGIGGRALYGIAPKFALTGELSYIFWGEKTYDTGFGDAKSSFTAFTILAGGRYNFTPALFAGADVGFYIANQSVDVPAITIPGLGTVSGGTTDESDSKFMFGVNAGYQYRNFELMARYFFVDADLANLNFTVAYYFAL